MECRRNWADLPADLLSSIAELLPIPDTFRFSAACKSWDSAAKDLPPPRPCLPWVAMIPFLKDDDDVTPPNYLDPPKSVFFSDGSEKYRVSIPLPEEEEDTKLLAQRNGWILFHDGTSLDKPPVLLNPITNLRLHLPSFETLLPFDFRYGLGIKLILPASPSSSPTFLTYRGFHPDFWLAFARPGDERWSVLTPYTAPGAPSIAYGTMVVADVQFHNGRFYVLSGNGQLIAFDLPVPSHLCEVSVVCSPNPPYPRTLNRYSALHLVSLPSTGDLLQVRKGQFWDRHPWLDAEFYLLKFDPETEEWAKVTDLGDQSLFLDWFGAMALSSRDVPGLETNCIHFANPVCRSMEEENSWHLPTPNIRVYDTTDDKKMCTTARIPIEPPNHLLRSMWFMPSLLKHR